jgi:hypothetical protein
MNRSHLVSLLLAAALLLPASSLRAEPTHTALGSEGVVYTLRQGTFGALFTGSSGVVADHSVLALDVTQADGTRERLLVPGTEGPETVSYPVLSLHRITGAPYVIWASRYNIHSVLYIVGLTEEGWTDVVMLSGDPFSVKSRPQLVATSKSSTTVGPEGVVETHDRTVLHVVWWDDGGWGQRVLYTAVVLDTEGKAQVLQILPVSDFLPEAPAGTTQLPPSLLQTPALLPGTREETVMVAFADAETGRLATVELELVPEGLIEIAEQVREDLLDPEAESLSPQELADRARAQIVIIGIRRFQPSIVLFIAERVAAELLAEADSMASSQLADRARAQIVVIGQSLRDFSLADRARAQIVVIGARRGSDGEENARASTYLSIRPIKTWEAPLLPLRPMQLFVSPSGENALIAWDAEASVRYVETTRDGWSETHSVALHAELERDHAYRLLRERVQPR